MTLFGPDLSHFQAGIDLARVKAEGCSFVIAKVSEGTTGRDPQWPVHRDRARQVGLELVGYHMIDGSPAGLQAANCKAVLGDPSIPLALDWEALGGSGDWRNFMAVLTAFRAIGLSVRLAYCPRWYWAQQGGPDMTAAGIPLWSSRYVSSSSTAPTSMYPAVTPTLWAGYGGLPVALLQFTDRAAIAGRQVDCSAFQGTAQQLHTLLYPASTPEDDVSWTHADGAPTIPDFYPGAKGPLPDPATALAWAAAHAAVARDAANAAGAKVDALRADLAQLRTELAAVKAGGPVGDPVAFAAAVAAELAARLQQ